MIRSTFKVTKSLGKFFFSTSEREKEIYAKLSEVLKPTVLVVQDTSSGCGSMFRFKIESEEFRGKTKVEQHQLVNSILKPYLKDVHGYNLETLIPKTEEKK